MNAVAKSRTGALSGPERAAALLLALGEDNGAPLWSLLDEGEVRQLAAAMARLGFVTADTVATLADEFEARLAASGTVVGSTEVAGRLVERLVEPRVAQTVLRDMTSRHDRDLWTRIGELDPVQVAAHLREEHPQTIAVVMSRLDPDASARVLAALPGATGIDVLQRLLKLDAVRPAALAIIERSLEADLVATLSGAPRRDPHQSVADILKAGDRATEQRFLDELDQCERDSARRIRALIFTFADLVALDPASAQALIAACDRAELARALKGATPGVRAFFMAQMSSRARALLLDEIEAFGPLRQSDVAAAQQRIIDLAEALAEQGRIVLARDFGGDRLVE